MPLKLVMVMNADAAQAIPIGKEGKVILLMTLCPCVCVGVPDQTLFLSRQARRFWRMWFLVACFRRFHAYTLQKELQWDWAEKREEAHSMAQTPLSLLGAP